VEPFGDVGTAFHLEVESHHIPDVHVLVDRPIQRLRVGSTVPCRVIVDDARIREGDDGGSGGISPRGRKPIPDIDVIHGIVEGGDRQREPRRFADTKGDVGGRNTFFDQENRVHPVRERRESGVSEIEKRTAPSRRVGIFSPGHDDGIGRPDMRSCIVVVGVENFLGVEPVKDIGRIDHAIGRTVIDIYGGIVIDRADPGWGTVAGRHRLIVPGGPSQKVFLRKGVRRDQTEPPVPAAVLGVVGPDTPEFVVGAQIYPGVHGDIAPGAVVVGRGAVCVDDEGSGAAVIFETDGQVEIVRVI